MNVDKLRIGIIGCGAIGSYIAKAIDDGILNIDLAIIFDINIAKSEELLKKLRRIKPKIAYSINDVLSEDLDLVVESASQEAVKMYAVDILNSGKSLLVLSTGALLDDGFRRRIIEKARERGVKVYMPSGAVGGLDALKAASTLGIEELTLITVKKPEVLGLKDVNGPLVVFEGDAEEAVKKFPLNINIAATIALAAGKRPKVKIIADPGVKENVHEVRARGNFGEMTLIMKNKRMEENPRTSLIAALSAIQLLKQLSEQILVIGT